MLKNKYIQFFIWFAFFFWLAGCVIGQEQQAYDIYYYYQNFNKKPSLPKSGMVAQYDVSIYSSLTFRAGSSIGVTSIKSQVNPSPDYDLVEQANYGLESMDAQYNSTEKSMNMKGTGGAGAAFKRYGNTSLITQAPYTIAMVCKFEDLSSTFLLLSQGYANQTLFLGYNNTTNRLYSYYSSTGSTISTTQAPALGQKVLVYISQDANGNHEIFMNNEFGKGTLATTPASVLNTTWWLERSGYEYSFDLYQLTVWNRALTDKEKAAVIAYYTDKDQLTADVPIYYFITKEGYKLETQNAGYLIPKH